MDALGESVRINPKNLDFWNSAFENIRMFLQCGRDIGRVSKLRIFGLNAVPLLTAIFKKKRKDIITLILLSRLQNFISIPLAS